MRTYDTYKDSGISWLGQIPSHWDVKRARIVLAENASVNSDVSVTKQLQFKYGEIEPKANQSVDDGVKETISKYTVVDKGDIMINGLNLNYDFISQRVALVQEKGCITSAYVSLRPTKLANSRYYTYYLKAMDNIKMFHGMGSGVRLTLSYKELKNMYIPIPPIEEQRVMADYIDNATAEIDKAIASQQRMVELLQERKQIIINQAVTQGLNPDAPMKPTNIDWLPQIPTHWDVKMFKHLYRTRTGITFTKAQLEDKGERVISYGQIHSKLNWYSSVNPELIRYIPESLTCGCDGALAYKGDFLFADTSEDFEGCGNCIYVDTEEPIYAGYHTILAKKNNEEHGEYLAFLFASTNWRGQVRSAVNGVKVYSITQTILNNTSVILPPVNEQKQIADYIQSAIKPIDAEITRCQHKVELLTERKQILINDVVTGKINIMY